MSEAKIVEITLINGEIINGDIGEIGHGYSMRYIKQYPKNKKVWTEFPQHQVIKIEYER